MRGLSVTLLTTILHIALSTMKRTYLSVASRQRPGPDYQMSLFNRLFRGKKSNNKENEQPTELDREMAYRRSLRTSSSSGRGTLKGDRTRFHDDIPATAPYHTVTAPRLHKGPMSCPGGYREGHRSEAMDRSFDGEMRSSREKRERNDCAERKFRKQRTTWDTSEYGSGDPSPLGNYPRNSHYNEDIEESDDQEWNMHDKLMQLDNNCRRFMRKYKHAEERHMYYKAEWKKIYKAKEESENVFLRQIEQLTKQHDKDVEKIRKLEAELAHYRFGHLSGANTYHFGMPLSSHSQNRSSMMPSLPPLPSSTATPSTSAVESITGAGEALTEQADLSMLRPSLHFDSSFNARPMIDDVDETKNFRALAVDDNESFLSGVEAPRDIQTDKTSTHRTTHEDVTLDDGYGTTSDNATTKGADRIISWKKSDATSCDGAEIKTPQPN
ncbi:hypothetical protein KIN20_025243 [Parelaphostrongylus tenuis]|uniref:Uncharacterized protein n=1 Tax=Parelaphostrongylus tenuis TaxID=148309 RepID=A0AAD5QWJ0_PARTN|nr:hypothetical protein KIN20_025243 [Parelaphostrongylus tenuis]